MTRRTTHLDHRGRRQRLATPTEVRQAATIERLRAELRATKRELRRGRRDRPPVLPSAGDYAAFLDTLWHPIERLVAKGKTLFGTCEACGNVKLPCVLPLFEMERHDYLSGDHDSLIFPPAVASGGVSPPLRKDMEHASRLAMSEPGGPDSWKRKTTPD
ncbi:MAG: hypothetical protein AAF311_13425 [Pseudomonadota bacterium]